jgi:hypothetical protein
LYGANLIQELYRCFSMARVAFEDEQGNLWAVIKVKRKDEQVAVLSGKLIHSAS